MYIVCACLVSQRSTRVVVVEKNVVEFNFISIYSCLTYLSAPRARYMF